MQQQKKVAVLGASGSSGLAITNTLLTKGKYHVNAFMRNPGKFPLNHAFARLFQGDATNQADVEKAIDGCNAVVVSISSGTLETSTFLTNSATQISAACNAKGIKKVVVISGTGALEINGQYVYETPHYPKQYVEVAKDHISAYNIYKNAGLDYTLICCPDLVKGEYTGKYTIAVEKLVENNKWNVSLPDLADFVLKILEENSHVKERVSISAE